MNAVDILKYGQQSVLQTLDGLPDTAWETPGACGVWSVKDIIAHLASYEHVLIDVLSIFAGSGSVLSRPYLAKFTEPGSQFNDTEVAVRKEKPIKELLGELIFTRIYGGPKHWGVTLDRSDILDPGLEVDPSIVQGLYS